MLAEYQRVCAMVDLDAVAYNMEQMRQNLSPGTKMIGVIKTDAYGHGAVQIARELERLDYVWGYAVATAEAQSDRSCYFFKGPAHIKVPRAGCEQCCQAVRYAQYPACHKPRIGGTFSKGTGQRRLGVA